MKPDRLNTGFTLCLALLAVTGCVSTKAPQQTAVMESLGVQATAQRVRVGAHNGANWFMSTVEVTADSIAKLSDDPRVRHRALAWKANAIPAIQRAAYHPDPLIAYVDMWTLLIQMREYLETGGGRGQFGEHQYLAVDALRRLETASSRAVAAVRAEEDEGTLRRLAYEWAAENPLTNELYQRRSVSEAVADILGEEQGGGFRSLGSMTEMVADAQQMAVVLASYMPKTVAWQSELLITRMMDTLYAAPLLQAVDDMEVVRATTDLMLTAPELMASERAAVFREIAKERLETFREIDGMRQEALRDLAAMVAAERAATLGEVAGMVAAERAALMAGMADLTSQAFAETRGLVNHLMIWIVVLGAGVAVLILIVAVMYRRRAAA